MSYLRTALITLLVAPFLQLVSASAAAQFHLNVNNDVSKCFVQCHALTVGLLSAAYYQANEQQLTVWCQNDQYVESLPSCLLTACKSSPDVAYAVEFGHRWCEKAGVDISEKLILPENYTQGAAKEYFESAEYLSAAHRATYISSVGTVLIMGAIFGGTFWAL